MTEPQSRDDFASFPAPAEGILVAMFITVREVARSRDFYSRVFGGTVILEENPCTVRLSNSWIIMNPGGPPTPDKPDISVVDHQPGSGTHVARVRSERPQRTHGSGGRGCGLANLVVDLRVHGSHQRL
jgi:hypothetical protein